MNSPAYMDADELSVALGLPLQWLKREAEAGRLPCLRAGRRLLFDLERVKRVLSERSSCAHVSGGRGAHHA